MSAMFPAVDTMTIAASGSSSSALSPEQGCSLVKVKMPAAMTGTKLTLQGSLDGQTFAGVTMDGSAVEFTFSANVVYEVNPRATIGLRSFRLASDGTEAAERTIGAVVTRVV